MLHYENKYSFCLKKYNIHTAILYIIYIHTYVLHTDIWPRMESYQMQYLSKIFQIMS